MKQTQSTKKSLANILALGLSVGMAMYSTGCKDKKDSNYFKEIDKKTKVVSNPKLVSAEERLSYKSNTNPVNYSAPWNVTNNSLKSVSSANNRFALESIVKNGERFYVGTNSLPTSNSLPQVLYKAIETTLVFNPETRELSPEADGFYEATKLVDKEGKVVHGGHFLTNGPYALKARVKNPNTKDVESAIIRTSEKDLEYQVKTFVINGEEYFTPYTKNSDNSTNLSFYSIPVCGTKTKILPSGQIALDSQQGIYQWNYVKAGDYFARSNKVAEVKKPITTVTNTVPDVNAGSFDADD